MKLYVAESRTKSRGNGEGSIRQRKDGRWEARITIGRNENGSQKIKYFYGKSRKEVAEKLSAYINESKKGTYIEPSKYTVSQWLDEWYKNYVVNKVKTNTRASYERTIRIYLKPNLGQYKLMDLKSNTIQAFYNKLAFGEINSITGRKLRKRSIITIHKVLRCSLQIAYINDLIPKNPAGERRITLPQYNSKENLKVFSMEEQKKIERACLNERLGIAVIFDLYTGLRRGELLALTWNDINLEKRTLTINKQFGRLINFDDNIQSKTVLKLSENTKTNEQRTISISKDIIRLLNDYRICELKRQQQLGEFFKDNNLIFCKENGDYLDPKLLTDIYKKILKSANVSHRKFHSLRHTFATRALEAGIPVKVVSQILGHSSIRITLDTYSHVLPELQEEAMDTLTNKILNI